MPVTDPAAEPVDKYVTYPTLEAAICKADAGKFCRDSASLNIQDVCANLD
jgi:hypothetical protein